MATRALRSLKRTGAGRWRDGCRPASAGRWLGLSYDGPDISGHAALAHTREVQAVMQRLAHPSETTTP